MSASQGAVERQGREGRVLGHGSQPLAWHNLNISGIKTSAQNKINKQLEQQRRRRQKTTNDFKAHRWNDIVGLVYPVIWSGIGEKVILCLFSKGNYVHNLFDYSFWISRVLHKVQISVCLSKAKKYMNISAFRFGWVFDKLCGPRNIPAKVRLPIRDPGRGDKANKWA